MNEVKKLTVATALRKMFKGGSMSICTIDKCLELAGHQRGAGGESYKILSALHCIDFADMPVELAERIPLLISDCFNGLTVDDLMAAAEPASMNNGANALRRLM